MKEVQTQFAAAGLLWGEGTGEGAPRGRKLKLPEMLIFFWFGNECLIDTWGSLQFKTEQSDSLNLLLSDAANC